MQLPDITSLSEEQRVAIAHKIKIATDFDLPELKYWNYSLCRKHSKGWIEKYYDPEDQLDKERTVYDRPPQGCTRCGIRHRKHQRVGAGWLYFIKRGIIADSVGTGKTTQAGTLIAMIKEAGEMENNNRVVVICRAAAVLQWKRELTRMMPSLGITVAIGTKQKRVENYLSNWDVMIMGPEILRNDFAEIDRFRVAAVIVDDVDSVRNWDTKTAYVVKKLGDRANRYVHMSGTPLQKRLQELYSVLEPIDTHRTMGSRKSFMARYVRSEKVEYYNPATKKTKLTDKVLGYQNITEFKTKLAPFALRRTAKDIDDVNLPTIVPSDVWLDLYPLQRAKYEELRKGVLTIEREQGTEVKLATAMAKIMAGQKICAGLASLGEEDRPMTSIKLDTIMDMLTGDLEEDKVVIFAGHKPTIYALQKRLDTAGIGYVTIWGEESNKILREQRIEAFRHERGPRVLIGTQAIEQSLNLQVASHLINVDMILNPARMEQLAGRIRRDGSAFQHVYVHNLLTRDTQEEGYLPLLEREQALIDKVWDETSELFQQLPPMALLRLITG